MGSIALTRRNIFLIASALLLLLSTLAAIFFFTQRKNSEQLRSSSDNKPLSSTSTTLPQPLMSDPLETATSLSEIITEEPSSTSPATTAVVAPTENVFEALRNTNPLFSRYADKETITLQEEGLMTSNVRPDNGSNPQGQFRVACAYSHFSYDDPIVAPGKPGKSHLHMFFGNTETDAFSTKESLTTSGGGSCQGFEINRSAYWTPALLDGQNNVVVPDLIIIYYKSYKPEKAQALPQGLEMIAGNVSDKNFSAGHQLSWSCGGSGETDASTVSNRIVACGDRPLNATIVFPNCRNDELTSTDHLSHLLMVPNGEDCPSSHPNRIPQISILLYYPGQSNVDGWHLSSDNEAYRSGDEASLPGGTLHADWLGGWNDDAMDLFISSCVNKARNCSNGQTGTSNSFTKIGNLNDYEGDNFLPLPEGSYQKH